MQTYLNCPPASNGGVASIAGRCHVGESYLEVVRYVLSRMNGGRKGAFKMAKNLRRYAIACAIQHHRENRIQYAHVMNRSALEFVPRYFFDKETQCVLIAPDVISPDLAAMKTCLNFRHSPKQTNQQTNTP